MIDQLPDQEIVVGNWVEKKFLMIRLLKKILDPPL